MDLHLEGPARKVFDYERRFPGGDREHGRMTFTVTGQFPKPPSEDAYVLTGWVDFTVNYDFRDPQHVMHLPPEILRDSYTQSEIDAVQKQGPRPESLREDLGTTDWNDFTFTTFDSAAAAKIFTKPVTATHRRLEHVPVNSSLQGNAHKHIDEAGHVWIKLLLCNAGFLELGTFENTHVLPLDDGEYEVRINAPRGHMRFRVKRGEGLVRLEYDLTDGEQMRFTQVHSADDPAEAAGEPRR